MPAPPITQVPQRGERRPVAGLELPAHAEGVAEAAAGCAAVRVVAAGEP
jgi:hypothetical protein